MTQNKFLLSTRYYMKGTAGIESIRDEYPLRSVLEHKTFELTKKRAHMANPLNKSQDKRRMDELIEIR